MFSKSPPKVRNLTIHVQTGATIGPKGLPLVYGSPDSLTILHAVINFETSHDCKAKGVEILFKAATRTTFSDATVPSLLHEAEQVFYSKHWDLEVLKPKPGLVGKGVYARQVSVVLDPSFPSSSHNVFGSMKYVFEARLKGAKGFSLARIDWTVHQEVWVLNSTLPFIYPGVNYIEEESEPVAKFARWNEALPFALMVPSKTLYTGQVVPVKVSLEPFLSASPFAGQEIVILGATFILLETRLFRVRFVPEVREYVEKVMSIGVNTGWPRTADGWERVIHVSLPLSPAVSLSTKSRYLEISHSFVLLMDLQVAGRYKPEKLRAQVDIQITAPRSVPSEPPLYGEMVLYDDGDDDLMAPPPPGFDSDEELPGYARYD
ncbi:hypothetical protein CPC16_007421 [Podila verticillata]|nr:hypothetical protein BGZ52_003840 [Haplosporangium bisporale]KAF9211355.1 hypothetical protein BGZ59_008203 [Podila verticillata]KAF9386645.1 hypothetical protein CPC16_007421 [Podila verticillata]KAI9235537.1 MAG: hypothetical protein BYD32DRAFT_420851 [Podila humilis]